MLPEPILSPGQDPKARGCHRAGAARGSIVGLAGALVVVFGGGERGVALGQDAVEEALKALFRHFAVGIHALGAEVPGDGGSGLLRFATLEATRWMTRSARAPLVSDRLRAWCQRGDSNPQDLSASGF